MSRNPAVPEVRGWAVSTDRSLALAARPPRHGRSRATGDTTRRGPKSGLARLVDGHRLSVAKVSQPLMVPCSRPWLNQRTRCAAVPCVKESVSTRPEVRFWIRSSPTAWAASMARLTSSWVRSVMIALPSASLVFWARLGPDAGQAVGHQLDAHRVALRALRRCGSCRGCRAGPRCGGRTRARSRSRSRTGRPSRRAGPAACRRRRCVSR